MRRGETSHGAVKERFFATSRLAVHCAQVELNEVELSIALIWEKAAARRAREAGVEWFCVGGETMGESEGSTMEGGRTTGSMRLAVGIVSGLVRLRGKTVFPFRHVGKLRVWAWVRRDLLQGL